VSRVSKPKSFGMIRATGHRLPGTGPHRLGSVRVAPPCPKEGTVPRNQVPASAKAQMIYGIIHRESTAVGTVIS